MFDRKFPNFYKFGPSTAPTNGSDNNARNENDLAARVRKSAQNYENYVRDNVKDIQFRAQNTEDESRVCSPPLWNSSTPSDHGDLSPNSRMTAIAKGQRELMEMAKNMPESFYELSLRDMVKSLQLVENPGLDEKERCLVDEKKTEKEKSLKEIRRKGSRKVKKRTERVKSENMENGGFFLKMVFPISMSTKRKKNLSKSASKKRVSPKVEYLAKSSPSDKDWWKKRFSGSNGSESAESGVTSTSSNSSKDTNIGGNRKSKKVLSGCWSMPHASTNKRKSK